MICPRHSEEGARAKCEPRQPDLTSPSLQTLCCLSAPLSCPPVPPGWPWRPLPSLISSLLLFADTCQPPTSTSRGTRSLSRWERPRLSHLLPAPCTAHSPQQADDSDHTDTAHPVGPRVHRGDAQGAREGDVPAAVQDKMGIKRRQEADFRRVAEERGRGGGRERDPEGTSPAESGKNLQAEETAEQRLCGGQRHGVFEGRKRGQRRGGRK